MRDIVKQVYAFAVLHGENVDNPADSVGAAAIATFQPKDRSLSPLEIRLMCRQMEAVATYPTIRLALRMILLTLVRKSELIEATWAEVDFENATWTIPKTRMKGRNPHVVYLSSQALDIFVALHTCAAGSKYVLPSRYDPSRCMSKATLNRKLMLAHPGSFPVPVHEGSASIWHLADVLIWLQAKGSYSLARDVLEVSQVTLQVNLAKEGRRLSRSAFEELEVLVG